MIARSDTIATTDNDTDVRANALLVDWKGVAGLPYAVSVAALNTVPHGPAVSRSAFEVVAHAR